jgi:hypothetical protein
VKIEPARPGDWRESWGKIEPSATPPMPVKKPELPAPKPVTAAPKPPAAVASASDPLTAPETFSRLTMPVVDVRKPMEKPPEVKPIAGKPAVPAAVVVPPLQPTPVPAAKPVVAAPEQPAVKPVVAAPPAPRSLFAPWLPRALRPAPATQVVTVKPTPPAVMPTQAPQMPVQRTLVPAVVEISDNEPNAFSPAPRAAQGQRSMTLAVEGNAFSAPSQVAMVNPSVKGNAFGSGMAVMPPSYPSPVMLPPAQAYAGVRVVPPANAPAQVVADRRQPALLTRVAPPMLGVPAGTPPSQLLAMLRDDLQPSHREWAAEALAEHDCRTHPGILTGLVTAAREDPAPSVRASCVRVLAEVKGGGTDAHTAVEAARGDADPRVRAAAEHALAAQPTESAVRPASATVPR